MKQIWLFCAIFITTATSTNIVFYLPLIAHSHLSFMNSLIDVLAEKRYNIDVVIARINSLVTVEKHARVDRMFSFSFENDQSPWITKASHLSPFEAKNSFVDKFFDAIRITNPIIERYHEVSSELCEIGLSQGELMEFMRGKTYDIAVISDADYCSHIIMHAAGIKKIATFSSSILTEHMIYGLGIPSPASITTDGLDTVVVTSESNIFERTISLLRKTYSNMIMISRSINRFNAIAKKHFGSNFTNVEDLAEKVDIVFANSNEILHLARPISHKVKYIGGVALPKQKPLSPDVEAKLRTADNIVIFSFGTQIPTSRLPLELRRNFVEAMSKFTEVTFVWKYNDVGDENDLFLNVTNVVRLPWIAQNYLLHDARTVGFISHMGLNSFLETAYAGVPTIAIPLFADQLYNAKSGVSRGITYLINKEQLSKKTIEAAINEIIYNESYRTNAKRISKMLKEKPESAKLLFLRWIEFALTNDRIHEVLNIEGRNYDVFKYYSIDCIALIVPVFIVAITLTTTVLEKLLSSFGSTPNEKQQTF